MALWPVFLEDWIQQDGVRLFELGDVVTLPVELIDLSGRADWPPHVGVRTTVTLSLDSAPRRMRARALGFSARTRLAGEPGDRLPVRAALNVDFTMSAVLTFVTGTVRRIELVSVPAPDVIDRQLVFADERWALTETSVAPVGFRHPLGRDRGDTWDRGILIHLELLTPRCRCNNIGWLIGDEAIRYAQRHLRAVSDDHDAGVTRYVCPDTDVAWIHHEWKRETYPGDPPRPPQRVLERHVSAG